MGFYPFSGWRGVCGTAFLSLTMSGASALAAGKIITVSPDGSGDYKTIQEAVSAAPEQSAERIVIHIKPGTYAGPFIVPKNKPKVTLQGEGAAQTILTYDRNVKDPVPEGVDHFNPGLNVRGAPDFQAEGVTIQNTSGDHGQALAARIDADRAAFKNCRLLGWQDTLLINKGRQYFKNCYIEGRVDFIYGADSTAVFEDCEIKSKNGGYVTAARTGEGQAHGFVFIRCKLTSDPKPWADPVTGEESKRIGDGKTYLGRPWGPYAKVEFIRCEMGEHIKPEGWSNWGKPDYEKTVGYAEYQSSGPGADPDKRVGWSKQLTQEEGEKITASAVLAGSDGWKPEEGFSERGK